MSSPSNPAFGAVPSATAPPARHRRALPAWLRRAAREPLLHFLLIGAALFALDYALVSRSDDPRLIVVDKAISDEARHAFRTERLREPQAAELQALTQRWVDNEILYREGLALGVDRGDAMIRDRVIFKSLMLVESGLKPPVADEGTLRTWFEQQRARYDEPARLDFEEAVLAGETSEEVLRSFVRALNSGAPGDAKAGLRVFKGRPHDNLVQSYGADFAAALASAPPGEWRALPARDGLRVVRLVQLTPARPADFEALRHVVQADWLDATMAQMRTDAVRQRGQRYTVTWAGAAP